MGCMRLLAQFWQKAEVRLLMVVLFFVQAELLRGAVVARLEWNPSSDANVVGYVLYQGVDGTDYLIGRDVGIQTSALLTNLHAGITNVFYVTAYDAERVEGEPSNLIVTNFPGLYPPPTIGTIPAQLIGTNS